MKQTGWVIYDGPSQLDGQPIVAIVTIGSSNRKTGDMAQTWIMRADVPPVEALKTGADASVCGECPLRNKGCYVNVGQAPLGIWRAWQRGRYAWTAPIPVVQGLRLGAYGDPAAVPIGVWRSLIQIMQPKVRTGYTHQWRNFPAFRDLAMASCDSIADQVIAARSGWRTFRVGVDRLPTEIVCPASEEAGMRTQCDRCGLCNGATENDRRKHITIMPHGRNKWAIIAARSEAV